MHALCQWVAANPNWSRWRLSRELATRWDWRNGAGVLKDMAARTLLVKLAQRGLLALPARRQVPTNRMRCGAPPASEWPAPSEPIAGRLAQAQALIAELKRELFGAKADYFNAEQEQQLRQLVADVQEQNQRPPPLSRELLEEAVAQERGEQRQRAKERRRRHRPPVALEKQQVILEPPDKLCPLSGAPRPEIGQEVTTEYDYLPAKLIIRETVRPKYGRCGQPCCQGVTIAPLPPRLVPQSKLGLGLAVHLLLSRFDDHLSYYHLERNFLERFGAVIPRSKWCRGSRKWPTYSCPSTG